MKKMTSYESETETFNDVNEHPPPAFDNNDDDNKNNIANKVKSLERAEDGKEIEEADDDSAEVRFSPDDSSQCSFECITWQVTVEQFNKMIMENVISALNDFLRNINDKKHVENVAEMREWLISM